MGTRGIPYRDAVHRALILLRGQWTTALLASLALGARQYKDILVAINEAERTNPQPSHPKPLTERTLTDTLRRAHEDGLVTRTANPGRFGTVTYALTSKGRTLLQALRPLAEWTQRWEGDDSVKPISQGPTE
ncbi:winged helix-turn-helix transcriptional regulator [Actinokineospora sp. G85]|uniref:winged helix-turn-helix transcriptional regulator n=1 Tax=Actinokineospora sp. G85 TaxID=3406626 RepID=UPI003C7853DA